MVRHDVLEFICSVIVIPFRGLAQLCGNVISRVEARWCRANVTIRFIFALRFDVAENVNDGPVFRRRR